MKQVFLTSLQTLGYVSLYRLTLSIVDEGALFHLQQTTFRFRNEFSFLKSTYSILYILR